MESIVCCAVAAYDAVKPISRRSAASKLSASESLCNIADEAIQIRRGIGYLGELPIERSYRCLRINPFFEGTNNIQRIVIARDILRSNGVWS
jgi:alkylation response protein AidB-like acyl-CoA dehydrogenase